MSTKFAGPTGDKDAERPFIARMLHTLAVPIILFWLAVAVILVVFVPSLEVVGQERSVTMSPTDAPSVMALRHIGRAFNEGQTDSVAMIVLEGDKPLGDDAHRFYDALIRRLREDKAHVLSIQDFWGDPLTAAGAGAAALHIDYPVALDNEYKTWNNYQNLYWPAEYLIDANGTVRHTKFGEGDYDEGEKLIRQLLVAANPEVRLPAPSNSADTTPQTRLTPETYLGAGRAENYGGVGEYNAGNATFAYPAQLADDKFALRGRWTLDDQGVTAEGDDAAIALNYTAKAVYVVVGGTGTLTVARDGKAATTQIGGSPTLHQIVTDDSAATAHRDRLDMQVSQGLQVFSFTFG